MHHARRSRATVAVQALARQPPANTGERLIIDFPPDPDQALVGKTIGERYELYRLLGKGGFGAVYATRHALTGQELVVKVLRANMAQDPVQLRRFLNEAKAACQLTHPNTVRVFDFGQTAEKQLYMAMERLNGKELADVVKAEAPLEPFRVIHIAISVLKSLSEAHAAGLVHRDLKPGNIFLCDIHGEQDFVKLIDFGIAKSFDGDDPEHDLTKTGFAVGTPKYMSPEQGRAEPLDGRSDLYSLGIIMYEALCGSVPFKASSAMAMIVKHMQEPPEPLSQRMKTPLPNGLNDVIMRALAKDPWDRFSDADDMRAALEAVVERAGRAVPQRGRAVSAKMRAVPMAAATGVPGMSIPREPAEAEAQTVERSVPIKPPGPAAKTAQAAGVAMRSQAAQQAATILIETGKQPAAGATAAKGRGEKAGAAPAAAGQAAAASAGPRTRIAAGVQQSSVSPGSPGRPASKQPTDRPHQGGSATGRLIGGALVLLLLAGGGWWAWKANQGEQPSEALAAAATDLKAKVGTSVREPLAARTGTRERVKPKLKAGSAKRAEVEKFHKNRFKGVGGKREPLSTREIDKIMDKTDPAMIRCVRKHALVGTAVSRISMDLTVSPDGKVKIASVNGDEGEGALGACIVGVAKRVRFRSDLPAEQSFTAFVAFPPVKGTAKPQVEAAKPTPKAAAKPKKRVKRRPKRTSKPKRPVFDGDAAL